MDDDIKAMILTVQYYLGLDQASENKYMGATMLRLNTKAQMEKLTKNNDKTHLALGISI